MKSSLLNVPIKNKLDVFQHIFILITIKSTQQLQGYSPLLLYNWPQQKQFYPFGGPGETFFNQRVVSIEAFTNTNEKNSWALDKIQRTWLTKTKMIKRIMCYHTTFITNSIFTACTKHQAKINERFVKKKQETTNNQNKFIQQFNVSHEFGFSQKSQSIKLHNK